MALTLANLIEIYYFFFLITKMTKVFNVCVCVKTRRKISSEFVVAAWGVCSAYVQQKDCRQPIRWINSKIEIVFQC